MKKVILLLMFSTSIWFCKVDKIKHITKDEKVFHISDLHFKFKYHELNEFKIEESNIYGVKLDSSEWKRVWQDSLQYDPYDNCYFYSTFNDSSKITIFQNSEEWSSNIIWYLIYDKSGKLKFKTKLAIEGGDGGDYWITKTKFISVNQWISTVLSSSTDIDSGKVDEDSIVIKYTILSDFLLKTEVISK